ncbi:MAG: 16S rRNA methyltransferase [Candidatus Bathyarchaeota archaeon]
MKLHLVFVETALELVPPEIQRHPSVRRNAKRRGKRPEETLLDRSLHHFAMDRLPDNEKRGRPDIIHFCLLEAMGSPLNRAGLLRVWVSTIDGRLVEVDPSTRPPRDFNRFKSLMEQLLLDGRAPPGGEKPLLVLRDMGLRELVEEVKPTRVVALTSHGQPGSFETVGKALAGEEAPMVLIGAYPSGAMSGKTTAVADQRVSVYPESLEAWTVTSRVLYEAERGSGVYKPVGEL